MENLRQTRQPLFWLLVVPGYLTALTQSVPNAPMPRLFSLSAAPIPSHPVTSPPLRFGTATTFAPSIDSDRQGSTNVPMDSWVYPALDRLGAMGLIPTQNVAIRPWTRQECRRQLREAEDILYGFGALDQDTPRTVREEAARMLPALEYTLSEPDGAANAVLESVYARAGTIAGPTLEDGFHFGQTWQDDFGRPLGRGSSSLLGYSGRITAGRFFFFDRQELQSAPTGMAITPTMSKLFNTLDNIPFGSSAPNLLPVTAARPAYLRQRPLELYAGVAFAGNALAFGKQELFWGPTIAPFSFSSNAEPTYNLRLVATRPHAFPFAPQLGSYRFDIVFGKLSGHSYPARPYFNGQKISLNFGRALELSFTRWSLLFGTGHPMTLRNLKNNLFSSNSTGSTFSYGDRTDPGDRKSDFDFRLRVPGLAGVLTLYADGYADDELNPIDAPRRVAWNPGLYLSRLPGLPHADLHLEAPSSQELSKDEGGTRFFINNQYRDANTNRGFPLGNAVGRDGRALEAHVGYWLTASRRLEAGFRQAKESHVYLPGGGSVSDAFAKATFALSPDWTWQAFVQYERFLIPSFLFGSHHNTSARIQIEWRPNRAVLAH